MQDRTEPGSARHDWEGPNRTGQCWTGPGRAMKGLSVTGKTALNLKGPRMAREPDRGGNGSVRQCQDQPGTGTVRQDSARQGRAGSNKTGQDWATP